tara:strand:+ start:2248 stop:3315 length:1068 start_codon:yes stop_codon:yes gene_type:complete
MKIKELKRILEIKKLDCVLLLNTNSLETNPNMFYFTRYPGIGALVIPKKQNPFLIVPEMEYERAKKSIISKVYKMNKKKFFESIETIIKKNKVKTNNIAIDGSNLTLNLYKNFKKHFKKIKAKDVSQECLRLRETKNQKEIQFLKKSCDYANNILKKAINNLKSFKTEPEMASFLEYETKKLGLDVSFPPIVASGINSSIPHHEPKSKLKKGFCVIDFGVKYQGYCSDMTRTIYLGKPSKKEKDVYNFLLNIQKNTIQDIKLGDSCGKIYNNCVKSLKNYSEYFTHGLGHGVGAQIHELPNLNLNSKDNIQKNQVFTIEPGIYIPKKFGIRIEDTILMKPKPIILTKYPKDLLMV